jgi:WD40 repeat protein
VGGLRKLQLLHRDGGPARVIGDSPAVGFNAFLPDFGPRSDRLFARKWSGDARLWSSPDGRELWRADVGSLWLSRVSNEGFFFLPPVRGPRAVVRFRTFGENESRLVASVKAGHVAMASGERMAHVVDHRCIQLRSLRDGSEPERVVGTHTIDLEAVSLDPRGQLIAARDASGRILVWRTGERAGPYRVIAGLGTKGLGFDPAGRWLAAQQDENGRPVVRLWDLSAPPGAEPLALRRSDALFLNGLDAVAFDPSGGWVATGNVNDTALWRLGDGHPRVLTGHRTSVDSIAFTPDGRQLVSASRGGTVRAWPLSAESAAEGRLLIETGVNFPWVTIDAAGRHVAVNAAGGRVFVVALAGGQAREFAGFSDKAITSVPAFSDDGRLLAVAPFNSPVQEKVVRVFDLETGEARLLGPVPGAGEGFEGGIGSVNFIGPDNLLAAVFRKGFVLFDLRDGTSRFLSAQPALNDVAVSRSGRFVLYPRSSAEEGTTAPLVRLDLGGGRTVTLTAHGGGIHAVSLDPTERLVATGSLDGTVLVGPIDGGEPHVLFGHVGLVRSVAFSPDGRCLASSGEDKTIRLWRVPDTGTPPFHVLPREPLLERLRGFTNLRVIADPVVPGGYKLEPGPFPGWAKAPEW